MLDHLWGQLQRIPPDWLGLHHQGPSIGTTRRGYCTTRAAAHRWQTRIGQLRDHETGLHPDPPNQEPGPGNSL